ncbi:MAG: TldD protein, part of TldE/TldD proteolytic complex [uncultured Chloroflexi bacterium]|uniref:TldD protein, part of TldE/TldD proteolytic complex n=1 Tax=uncultured Chloroflexota bacterium TaxID=166587 RepID=A0A6J4JD36_9CHLR|nr:MAG: TldD protein, part of TldE/TldD proteolytic complex [uncultured Chloroflexota bacterium]
MDQPMDLRHRMEEALTGHNADYVEIRIEETAATTLSYRGRELEEVGRTANLGGCVRAAYKGGWGFVSFNDLSGLQEKVQLAVRQARLVGKEQTILAPVEPHVDIVGLTLKKDPRGVPLAAKKRMMDEYVETAWSRSSKIQTTTAGYSDSARTMSFANSEGTYVRQERARAIARVVVFAREDGNVQQARAAFSTLTDYDALTGRHAEVADAADSAVALLAARAPTGGEYTVICDPKVAAVFAHEAFGHLSEGDNVYENEKLREIMVLGRRFGRPFLNISDGADPGVFGGLPGAFKYDDEGTPTRRTPLIKDGVLVGRLHSRETAGKLGEEPTGNARAMSYRHQPIVRMTNTLVEPGDSSFQEMLAETKLGIFCKDWYGGSTTHEQFGFSCAEAWMVRDGRLAEPLRGTTLSGNLFRTLENIDMVGRDFEWTESGGNCGKGGQTAQVGQGSPYIRIQGAVVGGK